MNCERMREQIPELVDGRLNSGARDRAIEHLESCSSCRAEVAQMGAVWRGLDAMPLPEPDPAMRVRFQQMLEAYQAGMQQGRRRAAGWWPERAAWRWALAASLALALLMAGGIGGRYLAPPHGAAAGSNPEIAQLQGQVENLRQMVALSMLQDQSSPSSRIRGVGYSSQVARPDREVKDALLHAVSHDANVNVRLSAVDALAKFAGNPEMRRALVDAIPVQDSPLVQIALIDTLVEAEGRDAAPGLRKVEQDARMDG